MRYVKAGLGPPSNIPVIFFSVLALVLAATFGSGAWAQSDLEVPRSSIITPDEIFPGMKGYGLSVFKGSCAERFEVEVIGVLKNFGPKSDLILIMCSGRNLEHIGVAHGMSGSPIFIEGRLAGALSRGFSPFPKDPIAGVTPIQDMINIIDKYAPGGKAPATTMTPPAFPEGLKPWAFSQSDLLDAIRSPARLPAPSAAAANPSAPAFPGGPSAPASGPAPAFAPAPPAPAAPAASAASSAPSNPFAPPGPSASPALSALGASGLQPGMLVPLATPLVASGFRSELLAQMGQELAPYYLVPVSGGGLASAEYDAAAEEEIGPGSVLGAALMVGDYSLVATGTATWREGDKVVAFGHPFLGTGPLNFPMTAGEVVHMVADQSYAYKISNPGAVVGELVADEESGVAGMLGREPEMVPFSIKLHRKNPGDRAEYNFSLVKHPIFTSLALRYAIMSSVLAAAPSGFLPSTVLAKTRMCLAGYGDISYENLMVISSGNLSDEYTFLFDVFASNPYREVKIEEASIELEITDKIDAAYISSSRTSTESVAAGDTLRIGVTLQSYRGKAVDKWIEVKVPRDHQGESCTFYIMGGAFYMYGALGVFNAPPESVEDLVELFKHLPDNNDLYVIHETAKIDMNVNGTRLRNLPPSAASTFYPINAIHNQALPHYMLDATAHTPYYIYGSPNAFTVAIKPRKKNTP